MSVSPREAREPGRTAETKWASANSFHAEVVAGLGEGEQVGEVPEVAHGGGGDAPGVASAGASGLRVVRRASEQEFRRPAEARPLLGAAF
jgi:hypothetical protein